MRGRLSDEPRAGPRPHRPAPRRGARRLRRLDGARVDALTDEKAALVRALQECVAERPDLAPRLRHGRRLRRNAVLLAHARDCLRDVLSSFQDVPGTRANGAAPDTPLTPRLKPP